MNQTILTPTVERPMRHPVPAHLFQSHRVLAAIDRDHTGIWATTTAMNLADQFDCDLGLVHVVAPDSGEPDDPTGRPNYLEGDNFLKQVGVRVPPGRRLERFVREGDTAEQILAAAEDWQADLLVVSTHSRRSLSRLLLGSVAADVIRSSPKPVLCTSRPPGGPLGERILVALDNDENAPAILEWAGVMAAERGGTIQLLHTVPVPAPSRAACVFDDNDAILSVRRTGFEFLESQHPNCPPHTRVLRELRHGTAATEIVNLATAWKADLIIIGSCAQGRVSQILLGGTTDAVLRRAECPVLCVRARPAAEGCNGSHQ